MEVFVDVPRHALYLHHVTRQTLEGKTLNGVYVKVDLFWLLGEDVTLDLCSEGTANVSQSPDTINLKAPGNTFDVVDRALTSS